MKKSILLALFIIAISGVSAFAEGNLDSMVDAILAAFQVTPETESVKQDVPISIPCGPEALTWKKFNEKEKAWYERTLLANYNQYGTHSEKWDNTATNFLVVYTKFMLGNCDTTNTLLRLARELSDKECTDPFLVYAGGNITAQLIGPDQGEPLVRKGLSMLEESKYPRFYLFLAAQRLQTVCNDAKKAFTPKEMAALNAKKMQYLGQAAADDDFTNGNQRIYIATWQKLIDGSGDNKQLAVDADVLANELEKNPKTDPWIRGVAMGYFHINKAWQARGGGYANTVTDAGWKGFEKEMDVARQGLVKAYELHPDFPEAAVEMIRVSMGTCGSQTRLWFNRAVAAQLDYLPAYAALRWALRPRWGGSHEEMYAFGVECLETKRFDTKVPWEFLTTLHEIGTELDDWRDAYKSDKTIRHLQMLFDGYEAFATSSQPMFQSLLRAAGRHEDSTKVLDMYGDRLKSHHAILLWAAGRYEDSAKLLDTLNNRLSYEYYPVKDAVVIADVRLRSSPFKKSFVCAEELFNQDQSLLALPAYQQIASNATNDCAAVTAFLKERIGILETRRDLVAGKWVSLMPVKNANNWFTDGGQRRHQSAAGTAIDLSGWQWKGGQWSIADNGTLSGVSDSKGLELAWEPIPGGDFEITGEVESDVRAGIVFSSGGQEDASLYFEIRPSVYNDVRLADYGSISVAAKPKTKLGRRNRFSVSVRGDKYTVVVNGETLFDNQKVQVEWGKKTPAQVSLGGAYQNVPNFRAKFRDVKIHLLLDEGKAAASGEDAEPAKKDVDLKKP